MMKTKCIFQIGVGWAFTSLFLKFFTKCHCQANGNKSHENFNDSGTIIKVTLSLVELSLL